MGNFKVTATRVVGEADTREEARELAESCLDGEPDCEVTIREATGGSADEKMTRTADAKPKKEKEPTRKK